MAKLESGYSERVQDAKPRPCIGLNLHHLYSAREGTAWVVMALLAVVADYALAYYGFAFSWVRALLPMIALVMFEEQMRKRPGPGWFHYAPQGGWKLWVEVSLKVAAWAVLLWFLLYGIATLVHWGPGFPELDPQQGLWMLFPVCVLAPLLEEGVYRILLCTALATRMRHRSIIVISGSLFAGLHFLYGTLAPTNLLAGYLLAWAYLMSGSLWIPILWHAVGNLAILMAEMALFQLHAS